MRDHYMFAKNNVNGATAMYAEDPEHALAGAELIAREWRGQPEATTLSQVEIFFEDYTCQATANSLVPVQEFEDAIIGQADGQLPLAMIYSETTKAAPVQPFLQVTNARYGAGWTYSTYLLAKAADVMVASPEPGPVMLFCGGQSASSETAYLVTADCRFAGTVNYSIVPNDADLEAWIHADIALLNETGGDRDDGRLNLYWDEATLARLGYAWEEEALIAS